MRIIDLSQPIFDNCPHCPVHPPVKVEVISSHAMKGPESWHMEHLSFASHTGSHVDAPLHKLQGGKAIDQLPLEAFAGPARIADLRGLLGPNGIITADMLSTRLPARVDGEFVLIATGCGDRRALTHEWLHEPPVLSAQGAGWLVEHGARGVGIDHYAIGDAECHTILLSKPVLIVEELHFPPEVFEAAKAEKGTLEFWALPINLRAHSGAPCRPVVVVR